MHDFTDDPALNRERLLAGVRERLLRGPRGHGFGPGGFGPRGPRPGFGPGFGPGGFGPGWGGPGARARKGDVRAALLSLLAEGPSTGYGLMKAIGERTEGMWRPSPGSVYPTLQQLVDEELIVPRGEGRRTEFELTDAGRAYVEEHREELDRAWNASGPSDQDVALQESFAKLAGVVHQFRLGVSDEQRNAAIERLDEARRALYRILAD